MRGATLRHCILEKSTRASAHAVGRLNVQPSKWLPATPHSMKSEQMFRCFATRNSPIANSAESKKSSIPNSKNIPPSASSPVPIFLLSDIMALSGAAPRQGGATDRLQYSASGQDSQSTKRSTTKQKDFSRLERWVRLCLVPRSAVRFSTANLNIAK